MRAVREALRRRLSTLDVVALGINGVIGSGIFLLPGVLVDRLGPASLVAMVAAGFLGLLVTVSFADAGRFFRATGGAYLYAREAFGSFVGFEVGWMTCAARVLGFGAAANAFVLALSYFVPSVRDGATRALALVALIAGLAVVNIRGSKEGAKVSTWFSAAKVITLLIFVVVGALYVDFSKFVPFAPVGWSRFGEAVLVAFYMFVGFEVLTIPAGEVLSPERAIPRALLVVIAVVSLLYLTTHSVAVGVWDGLATSKNPLADAAQATLGNAGGAFVAAGVTVSTFGFAAGQAVVVPRAFYAMSERGELPRVLSIIHPTYSTPVASIALTAALTIVVALSSSFEQLAIISVVARIAQYLPACASVWVFRNNPPLVVSAPIKAMPLARVASLLAICFCILLLTQATAAQLIGGAIALAIGAVLYFFFGRSVN